MVCTAGTVILMSQLMWTTMCVVHLLEIHSNQTHSNTASHRSSCAAELWLENVLRNHTSKGRVVSPWTGGGTHGRGVVMTGQTTNVWAKPWFAYCGMIIQTNGLRLTRCCKDCTEAIPEAMSGKSWQRTRGILSGKVDQLMRADGWSTNTVLRRRGRGNFKLYPDFIHYSGMRFNDADWMTLVDSLTAAWSAEDWHLWYASCNDPVQNEWRFSDDNSGEQKTLLKTLSYNGAIRSLWRTNNLELQEYCSLSQQKLIDPTNAVYAFICPHVEPTGRLPNQDVIDVSEMMLFQPVSPRQSSLGYGPRGRRDAFSKRQTPAVSHAKPHAPAPPPPSMASSPQPSNCSDAVNDQKMTASWNNTEPKMQKRRQDIADAEEGSAFT